MFDVRLAGIGVGEKVFHDGGLGIHIGRRTELLGDLRQRNGLRAQDIVLIIKR